MSKEDAKLLIKIAKEFESLEKEDLYLNVDIYNIESLVDSRHSVGLDDVCVGDYAFQFHIDGRDFLVSPEAESTFTLHIEEYQMRSVWQKVESGYSKIFTFPKSITKVLITEKLKAILVDIKSTTDASKPARYYFDMWVQRQAFATTISPGNQAMHVQDLFYEMLPQKVSHPEFEKQVATRFKTNSSRIDRSFKPSISRISQVEMHSVLDGTFFALVSKDEVFLYDTEEEALHGYEEQSLRRLGETLADDLKEYQRIRALFS